VSLVTSSVTPVAASAGNGAKRAAEQRPSTSVRERISDTIALGGALGKRWCNRASGQLNEPRDKLY